MAGTKFAYVKSFELPDPLLPGTFIVLRVDGHAFHRFTDTHAFAKPNDEQGLKLMDHAARDVMDAYKDVVLAFGESDEYSFLLRRSTNLFNRRQAKILTTLTSHFTAAYIFHWTTYFPDTPLRYPPTFDGRIVLYPGKAEIHDYFAWRQADTHINNLYNTAFWALVQQGGQSTTEAHATLRGTVSSQKHEILFSRFGINYNDLPARFRKGSILVREEPPPQLEPEPELGPEKTPTGTVPQEESETTVMPEEPYGTKTTTPSVLADAEIVKRTKAKTKTTKRPKPVVSLYHVDIIGDEFWEARPGILDE